MRLAEKPSGVLPWLEAGLDGVFESARRAPLYVAVSFAKSSCRRSSGPGDCGRCVHHPCRASWAEMFRIYDDLMSTGTSFVVCNVETNQTAFVARARDEHPACASASTWTGDCRVFRPGPHLPRSEPDRDGDWQPSELPDRHGRFALRDASGEMSASFEKASRERDELALPSVHGEPWSR